MHGANVDVFNRLQNQALWKIFGQGRGSNRKMKGTAS
jgi:hypothetical protein